MSIDTFDTPHAAALDGFPPGTRVVASAAEGDDAYVLLDTGTDGHAYLYGACVRREGDGWIEGSSGNGPGWSVTDGDLGTATVWGDDAPAGADLVRASCGGDTREAPVRDGIYFIAWWRVPHTADARVDAFRVAGEWIPA
jgi:hypothetical protein